MKLLKWLSVADRFAKAYLDERLVPLGINSSQHMYLLKVCEHPGISQDALLNSVYVHSSNVVRMVASLEKKGGYRAGSRLYGQCRHQCVLPAVHHLSCNIPASGDRQCLSVFHISWKKEPERAARLVGNGVVLMLGAGVLYLAAGEIFLTPLLRVFGATGEVMPFAGAYSEIILLGMPFLILTNGIRNLIRADSSPRYSMLCMAAGATVNTILNPAFIFGLDWGVFGAALSTILGQFLSFILAARYLRHFRTIVLTKECFRLALRDNLRTLYMGIGSCINQVAITRVQIVLNNSLTYYGAQSIYGEDVPLAACGIGMKRNAILLSVMVGISQGVQPIIGFHFGVGKYDRVRQAYLLAIKWNFVV